MAFKARTLNAAPNSPNAYAGLAYPRVVGKLTIPARLEVFVGTPSAEVLADDCIDVQGVTGDPWPGSSSDRNSKSANRMKMAELEGRWPSPTEAAAQAVAEKKISNPDGVARHMLKAQGMTEPDIKKRIARANKVTRGLPDLSDVPDTPEPPKRGPGRPRKMAD